MSTHPDEQYCSVNSYTNHALRTPAVSTGTGATDGWDALIVINVRAEQQSVLVHPFAGISLWCGLHHPVEIEYFFFF